MKRQMHQMFVVASATLLFIAGPFMASAQMPGAVPTNSVKMPKQFSHVAALLPDGILAWDAVSKAMNATNGQTVVRLDFSFTNISTSDVVILHATPSCGCTTVEMPPTPWWVPAGSHGQIKLIVNLGGKAGTLSKSLKVFTDKGTKELALRINIASAPTVRMTEAERAAGIAASKVDRQAVFKGSCATCHLNPTLGKYGPQLYAAACGICHEANPRASMVPDLHHLKDATGKPLPTSEEFWRATITVGKEGTLMPAFASSQGGPLNTMQIISLAAYLNAANPAPKSSTSAK